MQGFSSNSSLVSATQLGTCWVSLTKSMHDCQQTNRPKHSVELLKCIQGWASKNLPAIGFRGEPPNVTPWLASIYSDNICYMIAAPDQYYFAKVATTPTDSEGLKTWLSVSTILTRDYSAPHIVDSFRPTPSTYCLVFEFVDGEFPNLNSNKKVLLQLLKLLSELHSDKELQLKLRERFPTRTLVDHAFKSCIYKHKSDLKQLELLVDTSTFADRLKGAGEHVEEIENRVLTSTEFDGYAHSPIHGDFHRKNVLIKRNGEIVILDWDLVAIGDPSMDIVNLIWQPIRDGSVNQEQLIRSLDKASRERVRLYMQSTFLDGVLDFWIKWAKAGRSRCPRRTFKKYRRKHYEYLRLYEDIHGPLTKTRREHRVV